MKNKFNEDLADVSIRQTIAYIVATPILIISGMIRLLKVVLYPYFVIIGLILGPEFGGVPSFKQYCDAEVFEARW